MRFAPHLVLLFAVCVFVLAGLTRRREYLYLGFIGLLAGVLWLRPSAPEMTADDERVLEQRVITAASGLADQAQQILDNIPRTRNESLAAQATENQFAQAEHAWFEEAESGKPLNAFHDPYSSTAALRILGADSYLTASVQASIERCNDHDAALALQAARAVIRDARAALGGQVDVHFIPPDLSHRFDNSDNCTNE